MTTTFGDLELAAKTKEVLSLIVRKEVDKLRPPPRYATVASLDPLTVEYPGDPTPMPVKTGSVVPSAVGQIVRIEGPPGDRYIADVVGVENETVEPYVPSGSNEFEEGIVIGPPGNQTSVLPTPPGDVTGLAVTQGLEFENIYFIIEWNLIADATEYDVEVAEKLGANTYDLARYVRVSGTSARVDGLQPFTEYGVRVTPISNIGLRGNTTAWLDVLTTGDNTIPPQVSLPVLTRGATSLIVNFDPLDYLVAPDVARGNGLYEVQIDTANTFNTANLRSYLGTSSLVAFSDLTFTATWYARVRAIDTSGNLGAWSNVASLVAGQIVSTEIADNAIIASKIAAEQISSDKIVTAGLDAAVIKFGTMSGDRITANTLDVNRLKASTLTATIITLGAGGQIKIGNPTTNGIFINDQGIRAYSGGATTFHIDSSGNAVFSGNISGSTISGSTITGGVIQTGTSGARILLDSSVPGRIRFYHSDGTFTDLNANSAGTITSTGAFSAAHEVIAPVIRSPTSNPLQVNTGLGGTIALRVSGDLDTSFGTVYSSNGVVNMSTMRIGDVGTNIRRFRSGRNTVTTSSTGVATINHGLGVTPITVIAVTTSNFSGAGQIVRSCALDNITSTQFQIRVHQSSDSVYSSASVTIDWIAIY